MMDKMVYACRLRHRKVPLLIRSRSFRFVWLFRLASSTSKLPVLLRILTWPIRRIYRTLSVVVSTDLPMNTEVSAGLYIPHLGGIVINKDAVLGKGVYLSHNVTIGKSHRGRNMGVPKIGNHVFLGPGCVCVGDIRIGDYAVIGPNAVVTKDVPERAVLIGNSPKIISYDGSFGIAPLAEEKEGALE